MDPEDGGVRGVFVETVGVFESNLRLPDSSQLFANI